MLKTYILIGVGGFLGSISRFAAGQFIQNLLQSTLPFGTFSVNLLGSFIIGLIYGLSEYHNWFHPDLRMLLAVGFCGGFTTFSSFSYENLALLRDSQYLASAIYSVSSMILGIVAAFGGYFLIKYLS
jgi:CrcB protein